MAHSVGRVGGSLFSKKAAASQSSHVHHNDYAKKEQHPSHTHYHHIHSSSPSVLLVHPVYPQAPIVFTSSMSLDAIGLVMMIALIIAFESIRRRD